MLLCAVITYAWGKSSEVDESFGGHRNPEQRSRPRMPLSSGWERLLRRIVTDRGIGNEMKPPRAVIVIEASACLEQPIYAVHLSGALLRYLCALA